MWQLYALLSAVTASFVALLGKIGVATFDQVIATTLRSFIMTVFLLGACFVLQRNLFSAATLQAREWWILIAAGIAGALSWLFYFLALKTGPISGTVAFDRLSIIFALILSTLILGEKISLLQWAGAALMVVGASLIAWT